MKKCICNKCPRRFICWTQMKVFGDPLWQALFEAYLGDNSDVHESLIKVRQHITESIAHRDGIYSVAINEENINRIIKGLKSGKRYP